MSILISGMEMPTEGGMIVVYKINGKFFAARAGKDELFPLIPVPPHGRLVDADALIADLKRQCKEVFRIDAVSPDDFWITRNQAYNERLWTTWCESLYDYINTAPTVIEADYLPSTPLEQVWTELFGEEG